jgi:hypothetical protein
MQSFAVESRQMSSQNMPSRFRVLLYRIVPIIAIVGCGPESVRQPASLVRDSAGIRIVENQAPVWTAADAWRIAAAPTARIGAAEGSAEQQLFRVRHPRRRSDGSIVLLNAGTDEVRTYTSEGRFIRAIGRAGSGPGEFRSPSSLWLGADDSMFVADFERISVFDSSGAFVRSHAFGLAFPEARLDDGSYLRTAYAPGADPTRLGLSRPDYALVRSTADGTFMDTITRVAGAEFYRQSPDGRRIVNYRAPFGAQRILTSHRDRIYTGDGESWEVWILTAPGALEAILRRTGVARPVTDDAIRAFEADMLQRVRTEEQRTGLQQLFHEWSYPEIQPLYDRLLVDRSDNVWVRHFQMPGADSTVWTVFDASGTWLGETVLPGGLAVEEIGVDYVLGVRTDELGVESVELHTLVK